MPDPVVISPRKLIEVALPLDAINEAAAREKSIRHGHPSTLHLWWARRPLAAARAVIFAQLVNDPAGLWEAQNPGQKPNPQQRGAFTKRRRELFDLITELVQWENTTNEAVLNRSREEIRRSWREVCQLNRDHPQAAELFDPEKLPALHDPFAGGGAIPLEAQRLGLEAWASDLNPVAVLINKAMIEIPPKFAGREPVNPEWRSRLAEERSLGEWKGAKGLAEDVRYYGNWMREEAFKRIGHLYPPVEITADMARNRPDLRPMVGKKLTVIAWLWARTVASPNPAFSHVHVPLASTFVLSSKEGKEAYVHPVVEGDSYRFEVRMGKPPAEAEEGTKAKGRGANFRCLLSGTPIDGGYLKREGQAGRLGARLMAVVAEGTRSRIYLPPAEGMEPIAASVQPTWKPAGEVPARLTGGTCVPYGLRQWGDLFTPRQLVALTTFSDLVGNARERVLEDLHRTGDLPVDGVGLDGGGSAGTAYAEAVAVYLAFAVDKAVDRNTTLCAWESRMDRMRGTFGRQALPMVWDFVETNPFAEAGGDLKGTVWSVWEVLERARPPVGGGRAVQREAQQQQISAGKFVSTDPPYYDNIGYADLSDFFYVWLRRALKDLFPEVLATVATPKSGELVATPYRHGSKAAAEQFFLDGMMRVMSGLAVQCHPSAPLSIYYAFKQSDTDSDGVTSNSGWESFLSAVIRSGLTIGGTWPMRSELATRSISRGNNALASSIVLVCRKRPADAPTISRREFLRELNLVLPQALDEMTRGAGDDRSPVAPVDLSQAIIGPGMAVFSRYAAVLEADGEPMSVRTALQLINRFLAEDDFDHDTQFCLQWFDQHGWEAGAYGEADVLARAKSTSVGGLAQAGVIESGGGKVRLLKWSEFPADWNPATDARTPVWEGLHQLIRAFRQQGDTAAGPLLGQLGPQIDAIRQLAYRLYTLCERAGRAEDARAYNELITGWTSLETAAAAVQVSRPVDQELPGLH